MALNGASLLKALEVQEVLKNRCMTFYSRLHPVNQRFSTFFKSWYNEQGAKIIKANCQFF
jgi:hypothetical protein